MLRPFFQQYLLNIHWGEDTVCFEAHRDNSDEHSAF